MAQAYEYQVVTSTTGDAALVSALATADVAGWEVVGYATNKASSTVDPDVQRALLRRRL